MYIAMQARDLRAGDTIIPSVCDDESTRGIEGKLVADRPRVGSRYVTFIHVGVFTQTSALGRLRVDTPVVVRRPR